MKGYNLDGNEAVYKLSTINISGNVVPLAWFEHIKLDSGKPDTIAIVLLSDIVYWYRPIEVRDEETGVLIGCRKKFAADKLQRSYSAFAEMYGYSKRQVCEALHRLERTGLIDLDFRSLEINGVRLSNVLYVGLNVDQLYDVTHTPPITFKSDTPPAQTLDLPLPGVIPPTPEVDTYTETISETISENTQPIGAGVEKVYTLTEKEIEQANAQVDAMVENARKVTYENRDKIPEPYLALCDAYVELTGQKPTKRVLMDWLMAFGDWVSEGLQPDDIRVAYKHATRPEGGFLVVRPGSLTSTAASLKASGPVASRSSVSRETSFFSTDYVHPESLTARPVKSVTREEIEAAKKKKLSAGET